MAEHRALFKDLILRSSSVPYVNTQYCKCTMFGSTQGCVLTACRQLKILREEGKLPKGGLEAGKLHGLTKEDLKGEPLKIFRPSDDDMKKLEYVSATSHCLCCRALQCYSKCFAHLPGSKHIHMRVAGMSRGHEIKGGGLAEAAMQALADGAAARGVLAV